MTTSADWENGATSTVLTTGHEVSDVVVGARLSEGHPIVCGNMGGLVRCWIADGAELSTTPTFPERPIQALILPPRVGFGGGQPVLAVRYGFSAVNNCLRFFNPVSGEEAAPAWTDPDVQGHLLLLEPPDGRVLLAVETGTASSTVQLWDVSTRARVGAPLPFPGARVFALDSTVVDGRLVLMTCTQVGDIGLWDVADAVGGTWRGVRFTAPGVEVATTLRRSDGRVVVVGTTTEFSPDIDDFVTRLVMFDARTGAPLPPTRPAQGGQSLTRLPLPDGTTLLAVLNSPIGGVQLLEPDGLQPVGPPLVPPGTPEFVFEAAPVPLPDDGRAALATRSANEKNATVRVWTPVPSPVTSFALTGHTSGVTALAAVTGPAGRVVLASAGRDRTVRRWDPATAIAVGAPLTGHSQPVLALTAVPGPAPMLVSGSADTTLRGWDPATGAAIGETLSGHSGPVRALAVVTPPTGPVLVTSTGSDRTRRVWNVATGDLVGSTPTGHDDTVRALTVFTTAAGRLLAATGGDDGTVRLTDAVTGAAVRTLTGHVGAVRALTSVRARGMTLLVSAGDDRLLHLWDPDNGTEVGVVSGHTDSVSALAVLPRRFGPALLVSAGEDTSILVWSTVEVGARREPLHGHSDAVRALVALPPLPDGRTLLASGDQDGVVRVWDIP